MRDKHANILNNICVNNCTEDIKWLDSAIIDNVKSDQKLDKNIYIIASECDEYYEYNEFGNYSQYFNKYKNFNDINVRSVLCQKHNQVTNYALPLIISILNAASLGVNVVIGKNVSTESGVTDRALRERYKNEQIKEKTIVAELNKFDMKEARIYPEGVAFIKGVDCPNFGIFRKELVFNRLCDGQRIKVRIGSVVDDYCSFKYFDSIWVNYKIGGFASLKNKGINVSDLSTGCYKLTMLINGCEGDLTYVKTNKLYICNDKIVRLFNIDGIAHIQISEIISNFKPDIFQLFKKSENKNRIHYEGIMIRYGIEAKDWGDTAFYLILKNKYVLKVFKYGKLNDSLLDGLYGNGLVYRKQRFSSPGCKGIDISNIETGAYEVYLSCVNKNGFVFSEKLSDINI